MSVSSGAESARCDYNLLVPLDYEQAGVRYDTLDAFKRACQRAATTTADALRAHGVAEAPGIRGESAYLLETPTELLAHVEEGLGTKNLVADAMEQLTGKSFYRNIGIDTVATIVNDMITTGALPLSVAMHAAVGDAAWFEDQSRAAALADGFAEGCRQANAVWGGGETPALKGLVDPNTIVLAGSAIGRISPKSNRISGNIRSDDVIIFLSSSGVHTNGLTLCRALAERLPEGYLTKVDGDPAGRTFGEVLLDPSVIYVRFITACQRAALIPHYVVHITGHGWRKLMRASEPFIYQITEVRQPPPIFSFIQQHGEIDLREMYATFNMGAGLAIYAEPSQASAFLKIARETGYEAWIGGKIVKQGFRKAVEIVPHAIVFESETLQVR